MKENDYNNNSNYKLFPEEKIINNEEKIPLKEADNIEDDNIEEKKKLFEVLQRIENNLEDELKIKNNTENEDKVKEKKNDNNERETNICILCAENWENRCSRCCLSFMFSWYLPFLVIINLFGIFLILSIMNTLFEVILRAFICYFNREDKEDISYYDFYNFYSFYFKESIDEGIDFDLIEILGFLGLLFSKFYGFIISSILFMLLNCLSLFLIISFFSQYNNTFEKYSFYQILYLILCYILLFIGVGSSALLSQHLLIDNYEKYNSFKRLKKEKKEKNVKKVDINNIREKYLELMSKTIVIHNDEQYRSFLERLARSYNKEEEKQKGDYFVLICITSVIGFAFKYILVNNISYFKYKFDQKYNFTDVSYIYNISNNITDINTNDNEINNIVFSHARSLFIIISSIYSVFILISLFLYKMFKYVYEDEDDDDEDEKKEENTKCQIFGYMFYLENIKYNVNKNNREEVKINYESNSVTALINGKEAKEKEIKRREKRKICKRIYKCIKKYCKIIIVIHLKVVLMKYVANFLDVEKTVIVVVVVNVVNVVK